jgi:hypothetical protein
MSDEEIERTVREVILKQAGPTFEAFFRIRTAAAELPSDAEYGAFVRGVVDAWVAPTGLLEAWWTATPDDPLTPSDD